MKRLLLLIFVLGTSINIFSQEFKYSIGLNAYRVKYEFTYLQPSYYYYQAGQVDTFQLTRNALGPSFRLWYSHDFGNEFSLIAGAEGNLGIKREGPFIDLPIFIGGDYSLNEKITFFADIGASYNLMVEDELHSVFGNLELGIRNYTDKGILAFKIKAGTLIYQDNYGLYFEPENVIRYKASLLSAGISFVFESDESGHLERAD